MHYLSYLAGAAILLGAASCSQDIDAPVAPGVDGAVSFKVNVPEGFRTRAGRLYGDGAQSELNLTYAIYRPDAYIAYKVQN